MINPKTTNSSNPDPQPLITLITDFGLIDEYVGVLKGVILHHCPTVQIVDISHQIPPQNVAAASHLLCRSYKYFPPDTIHLVVVDPGVGTKRAILAIRYNNQLFIGPDNGVFSLILRSDDTQVRKITNSDLFLESVSSTFHGRDIMAPVAAKLACGLTFEKVGPILDKNEYYIALGSTATRQGKTIFGKVVYIDRFGNLCTNIRQSEIEELTNKDIFAEDFRISIGETTITTLSKNYQKRGTTNILALFDSHNYLEIAKASGNISEDLDIQIGAEVLVEIRTKV